MAELLERIYGILFQPVVTLRDIGRKQPLGQAVLVLSTAAIFTTWTGYFTLWSNRMFIAAAITSTLLLWFAGSAIVHLVAELLGGNGQAKGLLAANGYIQVLRIFSVPLLVVVSFLPEAFQTELVLLGGTSILVWEIMLSVIAIRENYGLAIGRAFLALLAPYATAVMCLIIPVLVLVKIFMPTFF